MTPTPLPTPESRAAELLAKMTIEQKMAQVSCYFPRDIEDTSAFAELYPHGVGQVSTLEARSSGDIRAVLDFQRRVQQASMDASGLGIPATFHMEGLCGAFLPGAASFPSGIGRASGWNPDLERRIGNIVGSQERAVGITHTFAPVLDVSRDPRMGRHGETYGEDPTLASALGVAYVEGLQADDGSGLRSDAVAKHFLGFHASEGGIHGAHCDIPERKLREVYGKPFQAAITLANLRGIMPCYGSLSGEPASASRAILTDLLRTEMGFEGQTVSDYGAVGNLHTVQRVAESFAHAGLLAMRAGMDAELHFPQGFSEGLRECFVTGVADMSILDTAVLRVLTSKFRMGLFDHPFGFEPEIVRARFGTEDARELSLQSARESIVLLKNNGVLPLPSQAARLLVIGPHAASARFFFGGYTHLSMAEGLLAAVSSMAGLVGGLKANIERTVPGTGIQLDDDPVFEELLQRQQPGIRTMLDELRARLPETEIQWAPGYFVAGDDDSLHEEALAMAAGADLVIFTLGGKHGTSSIATTGEGIDATNVNLPKGQDVLIAKVAQLGKPMIGVHFDGRPVSSDTADKHLEALIEAWNPAESGAEAIVDVLTGTVNPSGRLPVSVARSAGQVSVYHSHPNGSSWHQGESIGFADYVDAPHSPRYPFGYGLSYTEFAYSDLRLSAPQVGPLDSIEVSFTLRNTGAVAGTEIVQLYARDLYASLSRPVLELVGFQRVELEAGAFAEVRFTMAASQLAFLDLDMRWLVEEGDVEMLVGASSEDIRLRDTLHIAANAHVEGRTRGFFAKSWVTLKV